LLGRAVTFFDDLLLAGATFPAEVDPDFPEVDFLVETVEDAMR
jgi:hypothetical protein